MVQMRLDKFRVKKITRSRIILQNSKFRRLLGYLEIMKILTNRQFLKSLAFFKNPFPSYVYILQNQGNYLSNVYVERNISWSVLKHSLQGLPEQRAEILLVLEINKSLVRGHVNIYTSSQGLYVDEYEGKLIPVIVVVYLETHK